jgi:eukaryotic-like serine/threonine-protein kinase
MGAVGHTAPCPKCGRVMLVPVPELAPGTILGGFRIIQRLGQGGMGDVFLARQLSMDRNVALKILSPSLIRNDALIGKFRDEVRTLANLRHPNIVTAFDAGEVETFYYMAMAHVVGEDLGRMVERGCLLAEKRILHLFLQVSEALKYAWDEVKLIHHDIKPSNIMLDGKGNPVLLDFGLAGPLVRAGSPDDAARPGGTPLYISPEMLQKGSVPDFRSDMYSLGATMFCVATGRPPFPGDHINEILAKHRDEPVPDPRSLRKGLSEGTARLIQTMMAKSPHKRHKSWQELIDDFYRVSLGEEPKVRKHLGESHAARKAGRLARRKRRRKALTIAVVVVALIGLAAYIIHTRL